MKKTIFIIALAFGLLAAGWAVAGIPNEQCHQAAGNIDNSIENAAPAFQSTTLRPNPCAPGEKMEVDIYANYYSAPYFGRRVFENGDVVGHKMNTRYVLCADGRAKVENWSLYYIKGMARGVWFNHPLVDWMNQYKMEQCNSM